MNRRATMDLSIIIVNWNVCDLLRRCLLSLDPTSAMDPQPCPPTREIIVVDNASVDGSAKMVRREFPDVILVASPENLGYAGGNNVGAARASGDFLFILNPDTQIAGDALPRMWSYMVDHPQVGAVGPQLLYGDGSPQSSRRRFPTLTTAYLESTWLQQLFPNNDAVRRYQMRDVPADAVQPVDWLVGAALMIRRSAWDQVGPFDEEYFMYFEELDWCRRCRRAGWEIHFLPQAVVTHFEGKSSEQVVAERTIRFQRSKLRYCRKYFGAVQASVLRLFLLSTYAIQWGTEAIKWVLGHKRPLRRQRLAVYAEVLRSGLQIPRGVRAGKGGVS